MTPAIHRAAPPARRGRRTGRRRGDGGELNVAIVGNPQMEDIAKLTPELFTAETGITVNYTVLEEGTLREVVPATSAPAASSSTS